MITSSGNFLIPFHASRDPTGFGHAREADGGDQERGERSHDVSVARVLYLRPHFVSMSGQLFNQYADRDRTLEACNKRQRQATDSDFKMNLGRRRCGMVI